MANDDDSIEIDLGKITDVFKRHKQKEDLKEEIKETEEDIKNIDKKELSSEEKKDLKDVKEDLKEEKERIEVIDSEKKDIVKEEKAEEERIEVIHNKALDIHKKHPKEHISNAKEKVFSTFKNIRQNKYAIPVLLIIVAIFFSTFFRMYPADLPIADTWARDGVYNSVQNQIKSEINREYPNLPDQNKQSMVEDRFAEYLEKNKDAIEQGISISADNLRSQMQYTHDGKEYTYLLAIDPYLWYGFGKNYLECGHTGCAQNEKGEYTTYRNGRFGIDNPMNYISYIGIAIHKVINIFGNYPLMYAFFLIPVVLIGLSIIPAFFIGKRLGGNLGGFFASMIVAVNAALLGRTPAGFSDTDASNIIFPLFIMWFFIEAFYAKDFKKTTIYSLLGALSFFLYSKIWFTAHMTAIIGGSIALYIIIRSAISLYNKNSVKETYQKLKFPAGKAILFFAIAMIGNTLASFNNLYNVFSMLISFATRKEVAISTIWPNVMTTVAEFNTVPLGQIVSQMGGALLFMFALLGIILSIIKKDDEGKREILFALVMVLWFIATLYAFTKGMRFSILMVPAFAVAFGTGIGIVYEYLRDWLSKEIKVDKIIVSSVLGLLFLLMLVSPISKANNVALYEIPSYNDAWQDTLDNIKKDSSDGIGYVTTWWDFGHWFAANDVRTTFDGGDQGIRIHWVGKSMYTDNETVSLGVLRMLNCGQEKPSHLMEEFFDGDSYKAVTVLNKIIVKNRDDAYNTLKEEGLLESQINEMLKYTHCSDLLPQYFIASEDMVGKAGVWAHFGSWDFRKAKMWNMVHNKNYDSGVKILTEQFDLSEEEADTYYYEITTTDGDQWITGWPGYMTGESGCQKEGNELLCVTNLRGQQIPIQISLDSMDAKLPVSEGELRPNSIVYVSGDQIKEKTFSSGQKTGFSVILIPKGSEYSIVLSSPELADSIFTKMFYYKGHGLKHFVPFLEKRQYNGQNIYTYKIDWNSEENTNVYKKEEISAKHILIQTKDSANSNSNRTNEEALELVEEIAKKINEDNFEEIAREYSEGPSASRGGDLGWFGKGQMVKEFEDAAFALDKGEIAYPVKTQFGYHIIKLEDKRVIQDFPTKVKEEIKETTQNQTEDIRASETNKTKEVEIEI